MSKQLFLLVFLTGALTSDAFARMQYEDNSNYYSSERPESIAVTADSGGISPNTYGSERSEAIAVTEISGSISSSNYGSQRTDSVARSNYPRSFESIFGEGSATFGGNEYRLATFSPGENCWDRGFIVFYGNGWNYRSGIGWGINQASQYSARAVVSQDMDHTLPPPLPTDEELAGMTNEQLQSFIVWLARGFGRELGQFNTGDSWVKYFELNQLQSPPSQVSTATTTNAEPASASLSISSNVISDALAQMDFVSKDAQYKMISSTWGFKALQTALHEASRPPEERTASFLRAQAKMLNTALSQISTGDHWRSHLELGNIEKLSQQKNIPPDVDLAKISQKFDIVAETAAYRMIAQLPGFQGVQTTLRDLNEGRQLAGTAKREPSSTEKVIRK